MKTFRNSRLVTFVAGILLATCITAYAAVSNRTMALQGYAGSAITSAAALPLGASVGNFFIVNGTTAVTSMTVLSSSRSAGRVLTLKFASTGVTIPESAASIALRAPFRSLADSTLTLYCDGTVWREVSRSNDAAQEKDLGTAEALTSLADIAVASNDRISGTIYYSIFVTDGTDYQCRSGFAPFSAVNNAGTVTTVVNTVSTEAEDLASSSGTLTSAITSAAGTGKITLKAQPVSSLTQTAATIHFRIVVTDRGSSAANGVQTLL